MTSKVQFYSAMASYTATHLTDSWQKWTAFLTTASRLYKYPFHEQLMIFAQRPDATACAEYDLWNDTMRRYVRRGSKGIALWTIPAKSPGFGMCSTFLTPACGRIPATPSCGSFARSMRRRWLRPSLSGLARRRKTTWRNSLKASPPSLSANIGWNTNRTSSTSLTGAFWKAMMNLTSECSSEMPQRSALPTRCCPGVDWSRKATSTMRTF